MNHIKQIKLKNYRKFKELTVPFDEKLNILIGDNESGKSTILEAINLVLCVSRSKIETVGLENLFNSEIIKGFLASRRLYEELPELIVELYFNEQHNYELNGKNNSDGISCDGLKLIIMPNDDYSKDIKLILSQKEVVFPFEFYTIRFSTFSDDQFSGYKKFLRHILIDNSLISSDYAIREYVKDMYNSTATILEKNQHQNEYRKKKEEFKNDVLLGINKRVASYEFTFKNNSKSNLETDLTLSQGDIVIDNKGRGIQCFIKAEFALSTKPKGLDVILLEEPENHLSHINMKRLISRIKDAGDKQVFITTHNSLISSRLDLRKSIFLNSNSSVPVLLSNLSEGTSKFFIKAPDNNLLEFILSKKVILVEGDAEFILMNYFFQTVRASNPEDVDVHILAVDGTCFKRYLEVSKLLNIRTAIITDNDGKLERTLSRYEQYLADHIKVFLDEDEINNTTFEKCVYNLNSETCIELFGKNRRALSVQDYMLENKAEVAFQLLDKLKAAISIPKYIVDSILWINN